jgi:hypothetical protein
MIKSLRNSQKNEVVTSKKTSMKRVKKGSKRARVLAMMKQFTAEDLAFIEHVRAECKRTGIKCDLRPTKYLKLSNIRCSGYFDSEGRVLVCSMNRPDALGILAHEYAHLTQWDEGIDLWDKAGNSMEKIDNWLGGKRVHNIKKHLAVSRDLELDNERRTVKLINKWKLSIDVKDYVKKANSYVHFYNWMYYSRKWSSPGNSPYTNSDIQAVMSTRFNMKYDELTPRVYNAFAKANI